MLVAWSLVSSHRNVEDGEVRSASLEDHFVGGALRLRQKLSAFVNWTDRNTCVLFGDGAGAAVLGPSDTRNGDGHNTNPNNV